MSFINRSKQAKLRAPVHLNWMGGASYDISDPLFRLRLAASTCFFGEPMYYHRDGDDPRKVRHNPPSRLSDAEVALLRVTLNAIDPQAWRGMSPAELMESAIDAALAANPEATLLEAVRLRQEEHIRTTPQVILVRAAHHAAVKGSGLVRQYAPQIVTRADEPAVGLAYQLARFGKPIPNALKKAWRDALENASEYALAKYRLEGREFKLVDVVNLVHPKSAAIDKLMRDELRLTEQTWEAIISDMGSTREAWERALDVMGHMALLRNIRNLLEHEIAPEQFVDKLRAGVADGKQLPFRYYSAYRAVEATAPKPVLTALEDCLTLALGNLPRFSGRVMSLCDNSGSARGATTSSMGTVQISSIANLTAVIAALQADEGHIGVFGDRLATFRAEAGRSVFSHVQQADQLGAGVGGATENGVWLFWDAAIRERQHWDMVFIMSDMQAGHGGLYGTKPAEYADFIWSNGGRYIDVAKLVTTYRERVNPKVLVFLIQVAGYQDTILPEFYDRTYILGGWGEGVLRFAADMAALNQSA